MDEVHYLLGNSCNLDCQFCFWDLRLPDISLFKKKKIIDEIKKMGAKKITISGGESTLNKDLISVLKYAKSKNLEIILHTNGLLINAKLAKKLKSLVSRISLSLDGSNKEVFFKMRNNKKIFAHTLWLIKKLCDLKIPVNVKTLVTKINQDDIKNIGEIISKFPIKYWSLLEFNPINRGLKHKDKFYLSSKEFDKTTQIVQKEFPNLKIKTRKFTRNPDDYCFIASNGDIYKYQKDFGDKKISSLF